MALFIVERVGTGFTVRSGENTLQAAASAVAAALSAATAEAAAGPTYASTAAGLAATTSGQAFAVDAGGGLVSVYLNSSGTAVLQRTLATTAALAASGGSSLVGHIASGTGAVARTVQSKLLPDPLDWSVNFDGSPADSARIASFFNNVAPRVSYSGDFLRHGGRTYLGDWSVFNGAFGGYFDYTGISDLTKALHNWAPREATLGVDSHWGSIAIVGSSQASKRPNWPAAATSFQPATIGVSGFAINDMPVGQAFGGYFDAVRMAGTNGFTTGVEIALANFGDISDTGPFTLINGSQKGGTLIWTQSGAGMSLIASDIAQEGLAVSDVNHTSAIAAFTGMQQLEIDYPNWANSTAYVVGDIREDPVSGCIFRCIVAHTSPASGTFAADRAANLNRWKQNPGSLKGIIFGAGALAERSAGGNIFSAIEMPHRHIISWKRKTSSGAVEDSAVFYADQMPDGTPTTQLILRPYSVFTNGVFAGSADGTTGANIQGRGSGGGHSFSFRWTGTQVEIYVNNTLVKTI